MKKHKALIYSLVSLVLVAGCFGIYFLFDSEEPEVATKHIFECRVADIKEYEVSTDTGGFVLVKSDETWSVRDNETAILDQAKVQELMGNIAVITVYEDDAELDSEEFDSLKRQNVRIVLANGDEHTFEFADINKEKCALRISGDNRIYTSHMSLKNILVAKLENLRVSLVFEGVNITEDSVSYYSFENYEKEKTVVRAKNATEIALNKNGIYIMEEPHKKDVDDDLFEQQILMNLSTLVAKKYVDNPSEDLAEYGLDPKSRAELRFVTDDKECALYLGKIENGLVYAELENADDIFLVNASSLDFLKADPFYILNRSILKYDVENISSITVQNGDSEYRITAEKDSESNEIQCFVNGNAASEDSFLRITEAIQSIELKSELVTIPEVTESITVEIVFRNNSEIQHLGFVSISEKDYAMFADGTADFAVDKEAVDGFLAELDTVSKNPLKAGEKG